MKKFYFLILALFFFSCASSNRVSLDNHDDYESIAKCMGKEKFKELISLDSELMIIKRNERRYYKVIADEDEDSKTILFYRERDIDRGFFSSTTKYYNLAGVLHKDDKGVFFSEISDRIFLFISMNDQYFIGTMRNNNLVFLVWNNEDKDIKKRKKNNCKTQVLEKDHPLFISLEIHFRDEIMKTEKYKEYIVKE